MFSPGKLSGRVSKVSWSRILALHPQIKSHYMNWTWGALLTSSSSGTPSALNALIFESSRLRERQVTDHQALGQPGLVNLRVGQLEGFPYQPCAVWAAEAPATADSLYFSLSPSFSLPLSRSLCLSHSLSLSLSLALSLSLPPSLAPSLALSHLSREPRRLQMRGEGFRKASHGGFRSEGGCTFGACSCRRPPGQ
jgi:hypothetical protein